MACSCHGAVLGLHPTLQGEEQLQGQHQGPERLNVCGSRQLGSHPVFPVKGFGQGEI